MEVHETLVLHVCRSVCLLHSQTWIWVSIPQETGFLMVSSPIMDTSSCGHCYMICVLPFLDLSLVHPCPATTGFILVIAIRIRSITSWGWWSKPLKMFMLGYQDQFLISKGQEHLVYRRWKWGVVSTKGVEALCCNARPVKWSRNILRQHQYLHLVVQTDCMVQMQLHGLNPKCVYLLCTWF